MNTVTSSNFSPPQNLGANSVLASSVQLPEQAPQQQVKTDAEVVANVASTEIKSSNINEAAQPTKDVIAKTAQQLESFVQSMGRDLSFSIDSTTGYHIVRVTNPETGEVVRQLPSEELLKIAESMQQTGSGLVNQKA